MQTTYKLKPMKGLTAWTRGLIIAFIASLALYGVAMVSEMVGFAGDVALMVVGLSALVFILFYLASGIVTLVWIHGAAGNARALRPSMQLTPGWAVGWFFIPFANLYKPYTVIRDIWDASGGNAAGRSRVASWWWLNIIGNIATSIGTRLSKGDTFTADIPDLLSLGGMLLVLASTWIFLGLVGDIHRAQMSADTRVADTF